MPDQQPTARREELCAILRERLADAFTDDSAPITLLRCTVADLLALIDRSASEPVRGRVIEEIDDRPASESGAETCKTPRFVVVDDERRIFFADSLAAACDRRIAQGSGTIYAPLAYETAMKLEDKND